MSLHFCGIDWYLKNCKGRRLTKMPRRSPNRRRRPGAPSEHPQSMLAQPEARNTPGPSAAGPERHAAQQHSRRRCPIRHEARWKRDSSRQRSGTAHASLLAFPQRRQAQSQAQLGLRGACCARAACLHDALFGVFTYLSTQIGPPPGPPPLCACCRLCANPRQAGSMQVQAQPGALPAQDSMMRHHAQPTPPPPSARPSKAVAP